ncbi:MAG TPA: AAA family ATPase [Tepidisphaeraceae bacterium]|nr:AAA family ATPase [Tepidisphaeraceae bacterium]
MPRTDLDCLNRLLSAGHACVYLPTFEEDHAMNVVRSSAAEQGRELLMWSVTRGVSDGMLADDPPIADTANPAGALTHLAMHLKPHTVIAMLDLAGHLKDDRVLRCLRELIAKVERTDSTLMLIDAASSDLPAAIAAVAVRLDLSLPGPVELEDIVRRTVREAHRKQSVDVQLRKEDLQAIVQNLQGLSRRSARQAIIETLVDDRRLDSADVPGIIAFKKRALRAMGVLEPVESFATLEEIGGMTNLKAWLNLRSRALSDEAAEFGIEPPRGVLMLGVQGAGKSLSAKAVAAAWKRPLMRLDVGALYNSFIGETERRLRDALQQAEMMAPVILWIDEIEKAFASAASQSSDGGLSKRMFGSLLTWMQEHRKPVFIIATANDVSALPPELLRKGRFDEIFFIDLPNDTTRRQIVEIHLKKRNRDPELFDLDAIVTACDGYSGAEIEAGIKASIYTAFESGSLLSTRMIVEALQVSPPLSVTMAEKLASLRQWAAGRCVPAD